MGTLLQGDIEEVQLDLDLDKKIKPQKVQPPKARKVEPIVSQETVDTVAKVKPGKTKVVEEMVEDSGEADVVDADDTVAAEEVIDNADADIVDNTDIDDGFNNSPDYPDDPTFRGTIEI